MQPTTRVLCLPGGFSYGDDIVRRACILANQLRHHLVEHVLQEFHADGKLILGICNGFQVLIKSGLLDTDDSQGPTASLCWNESGRYVDRWVDLKVAGSKCVFLAGIETMFLPIAHAEGRFVVRDEDSLKRMENEGQLVLRYAQGSNAVEPYNPNGATADVAGICDTTGRVFGMMPHPERFIDPTHHPQWTRLPKTTEGEGLQIFRNAVRYFS